MKSIFFVGLCCLIAFSKLKGQITAVANHASEGCNGSIVVTALGTVGPFTLRLDNGSPEVKGVSGNFTFNSLCPGKYNLMVIAERFEECLLDLELDVLDCDIKIEGAVDDCQLGNGTISLTITGGLPPYNYIWSDNNNQRDRKKLQEGEYCVTVTDSQGCEKSKCFLISRGFNKNLVVTSIKQPYSQDSYDGSITVFVDDLGSYTYHWSNGDEGSTVNNLIPGTYTVTATSETGCTVSKSIDLQYCIFDTEVGGINNVQPNFDAVVEGGLAFIGDDSVYLKVLIKEDGQPGYFGNIPGNYTIKWELPGGTIFGLDKTDFYGNEAINIPTVIFTNFPVVEIKVIVSNGCLTKTISKFIYLCGSDLKNSNYNNNAVGSFFVNVIHRPCEGFNDGEIEVVIPNPNREEIMLTIDSVIYAYSNDGRNPVKAKVSNLFPGKHSFEITIGACSSVFEFDLVSQPFKEEFLRLENDQKICVYDQKCGQLALGEYKIESTLENNFGLNLFEKCKAGILCKGENKGIKTFGLEKVRGAQYKELLDYATFSLGLLSTDEREHRLDSYYDRGFKDCDVFKFCPVNFFTRANGPIGNITRGNGILLDECTLNCGGNKVDICQKDGYFPQLEDSGPLQIDNCNPTSKNLKYLYTFDQALMDDPRFGDEYKISSLHSFVINNGYKQGAGCAEVTYCQSDFSFLYSNFDEVTTNCGQLLPFPIPVVEYKIKPDGTIDPITSYLNHYCESRIVYENGNQVEYVACEGSDFAKAIRYKPIFALVDPNANPELIRMKIIKSSYEEEHLIDFATGKNEGAIIPKGIISGSEIQGIYAYNHPAYIEDREDSTNYVSFIDDWDSNQEVFVIRENDKVFHLSYEDSLTQWQNAITTSSYLDIRHLSKTATELFVVGVLPETLRITTVLFFPQAIPPCLY